MIDNGKNKPLDKNFGTLPNLSGALKNWFVPLTFEKITKSEVNHMVKETKTVIDCKGSIQPMGPRELSQKPEGQRAWKWFKFYTDTSTNLEPDDVIKFQGLGYRIKEKWEYSLYGFIEYDMVEDVH